MKTINTDMLENIICVWAERIWLSNRPAATPDDFAAAFAAVGRGLNKLQQASERGLAGYLMAVDKYAKPDMAHVALDNTLVTAWTRAVLRNSFQKKYAFFEKEAYALSKAQGTAAVVAAYPVALHPGFDTPHALSVMNYASPMLTIPVVARLAQKAMQPPSPPPPVRPEQ